MGVAAAAHLARAGAAVELFERDELAAAASGRNSGSIQHPFDAALAPLHAETLAIYRELEELALPAEPAGVLMLGTDATTLRGAADGLAASHPELEPRFLDEAELAAEEGETTAGCLARNAELSPASMTAMLDQLEREGYVTRRRSEEDRRQVIVSLTDRGREKLAAKRDAWVEKWRAALGELSEDELASAAHVMRTIAGFLDTLGR